MREYDYGERGNLIAYREKRPPIVDLSHVTVPTALFFADHDMIDGDAKNIAVVRNAFPNCRIVWDKVYRNYGHHTWILYDSRKASIDPNFFIPDVLRVLDGWGTTTVGDTFIPG